MKLFTKISFIVAGVALGLGVLGVCIGLAMGADAGDLSEMGIYISPHHQVAVSRVMMEAEEEIQEEMEERGADAFEETFYIYEDKITEHNTSVSEHNHTPSEENIYHSYRTVKEEIKRLEIDVKNAEIYIFSTEEAKLYFDSNRKKEIGRVEGKTLKLEEEFSREPLVLEIYIPEDLLKEIDIKADGGILHADKIVADKVSIEIDAGEAEVNQLIANNQAEIRTNAGKIIVGFFEGPKLELDCDMGSVMLVCEGNKKDYDYKLECGMGQIVFDEERYSGLGEEIHIKNGTNKLIEADCDVGEIILEFPNSL